MEMSYGHVLLFLSKTSFNEVSSIIFTTTKLTNTKAYMNLNIFQYKYDKIRNQQHG